MIEGDRVFKRERKPDADGRTIWFGTIDEVYDDKATVVWDATGCATDDVPLSSLNPLSEMTAEQAVAKSTELNKTGKFRDEWFYYPAYHEHDKNWFVQRRRKLAELRVAIFNTGEVSGLE